MARLTIIFEIDADQAAAERAVGRQIAKDMLKYAAKQDAIVSCRADYEEEQ